jgi:hypothetical protein
MKLAASPAKSSEFVDIVDNEDDVTPCTATELRDLVPMNRDLFGEVTELNAAIRPL